MAISKLGLEFLKINLTHDINTIQYQYHTKGPGLALEHPNEKVKNNSLWRVLPETFTLLMNITG